MAPSTGKLIKFLVEDGGHVNAKEPYCEMEVMKMVTTLLVSFSTLLHSGLYQTWHFRLSTLNFLLSGDEMIFEHFKVFSWIISKIFLENTLKCSELISSSGKKKFLLKLTVNLFKFSFWRMKVKLYNLLKDPVLEN